MHTVFEKIKRNKVFLGAVLIIAITCILPVPTKNGAKNENPDDSTGFTVSKNHPLSFTLLTIPLNTTTIRFWTGETTKIPLGARIEIVREDGKLFSLPFTNQISEERTLTIPTTSSLHTFTIQTPTLSEKDPLIIHTSEENKDVVAYTTYENKPFIVALYKTLSNRSSAGDDIEYVWREGTAVMSGGSPYQKAATTLHKNDKYATYFPLSYLASALIQKLGFTSFDSWLAIIRPILLIAQVCTAFTVLIFLVRQKKILLGLAGFFIILFHRFTLYPALLLQIDFPAILFLLIGIMILKKHSRLGYLAIGMSLAIKQMSVVLLPLFLIWEYQQRKSKKKFAEALILMLIIPLFTFLPFLITHPQGIRESLNFSSNRSAGGDFTTPDIATMLSISGGFARMGMYTLIAFILIAYWRKEVALYGACLAIFTIFIGFNPVLFYQYLSWIIPFIPLALGEARRSPQ
jgi:hypothetical protein